MFLKIDHFIQQTSHGISIQGNSQFKQGSILPVSFNHFIACFNDFSVAGCAAILKI